MLASGPSLAAALLDELSEHPAGGIPFCSILAGPRSSPTTKQVFRSRTVQELLGRSEVRTTMIYTHVLNRGGRGVQSPVDRLLSGVGDSC